VGNMAFTAPSTANYIFYDLTGTNFFMIRNANKDTGVASAILSVQE
jgi:hypothetical protein